MNRLPKWVIPSKFPAIYDTESSTAIEMTAKLYGAMGDLIDEYNKFVENVNASIEEFENGMKTDYEEFTVGLRQEFQDFIDVMELRITDAENYLKNNLNNVVVAEINKAISSGSLKIADSYDEATESYNLIVTGGV